MELTIGQFNESFPPIVDGVANVVMNYANWMNKKYGKCFVITTKYPGAVDNYDYDVLRYSAVKVPTRKEYRVGLPNIDPVFWKEFKKVPFDIVHAHSPFGSGMAAKIIAKKRGIPFVVTFHSKYKDDFKAALKSDVIVEGVIQRLVTFYEAADEVWSVNESSAETLHEYGYKGDIHIMENGCDIGIRYRSPETDREIEEKFGVTPGTPIFMYIGQHIWQKNLKIIIEALKLLSDRNLKFRMLFIGDGPKRPDMEQMVTDFGLNDLVTFAGRIYDRELIAKIYSRSSAMLFPSLYDTSSLVPREAAACGCPTVFVRGSSTSQGITEESGFFAENNAESLAETVEAIIRDTGRAAKVGDNARATLYRSWEDAIEKAYERYLYLIELKKSERGTAHVI